MAFLRPLGQTGMTVSAIGLGTVKLGRATDVKYPEPFRLPDDDEAAALLATAANLGINLIDTAPAYGVSEERIGSLMRANRWFGGRDRWLVSTKAGEEYSGGRSTFDFAPGAIRASVERSLVRLGTDRLDIVLLHSDGRDEWIASQSGAPEALETLHQQGKVRAYGLSVKTPAPESILRVPRARAAVMVTYNPGHIQDEPLIRLAAEEGAGVLIKKGLASGWAPHLNPSATAGDDPVEANLRFILKHPGVSSIVIGSINPAHLKQNVEAARKVLGE